MISLAACHYDVTFLKFCNPLTIEGWNTPKYSLFNIKATSEQKSEDSYLLFVFVEISGHVLLVMMKMMLRRGGRKKWVEKFKWENLIAPNLGMMKYINII